MKIRRVMAFAVVAGVLSLCLPGSPALAQDSVREHDIRVMLREGASDREIADCVIAAVEKKERGHRIGHPDFVKPWRTMSSIGG